MLIALLRENVVVSIVTVNGDEEYFAATHSYDLGVDITGANPMPAIGWVFLDNHLEPGPGQSATPTRKITKLGLRRRLTFPELVALENASLTNMYVAALKGNLQVSTYVDLDRADTISAMGLLTSLGLLTPERAAIILSTPISEDERYKGTE